MQKQFGTPTAPHRWLGTSRRLANVLGSEKIGCRTLPSVDITWRPKYHLPKVNSLICPLRTLSIYLLQTKAFRQMDQMFLCFKQKCQSKPLSKARLLHWVVETIQMVYKETGGPSLPGLSAHSTWGVATSWALWHGASLKEISLKQPCGLLHPLLLSFTKLKTECCSQPLLWGVELEINLSSKLVFKVRVSCHSCISTVR